MEKAPQDSPYLSVNFAEGSRRQAVPSDTWFIVKKGIPQTDNNQSGEEMLEGIPCSDGYDKVIERLKTISKEQKIEIAMQALLPPAPKAA